MSVITTAFETAARARARVLGMQAHPIVAMPHPLASRTEPELRQIAEQLIGAIVQGLTKAP